MSGVSTIVTIDIRHFVGIGYKRSSSNSENDPVAESEAAMAVIALGVGYRVLQLWGRKITRKWGPARSR